MALEGFTDERGTADIICQAFPKQSMFGSPPNGDLTITDLNSALFRARRFSKCDTLGGCIEWARSVMNGEKRTIKKMIIDKLDRIIEEQEAGANAGNEKNQ